MQITYTNNTYLLHRKWRGLRFLPGTAVKRAPRVSSSRTISWLEKETHDREYIHIKHTYTHARTHTTVAQWLLWILFFPVHTIIRLLWRHKCLSAHSKMCGMKRQNALVRWNGASRKKNRIGKKSVEKKVTNLNREVIHRRGDAAWHTTC